jgi:hypothetical protein
LVDIKKHKHNEFLINKEMIKENKDAEYKVVLYGKMVKDKQGLAAMDHARVKGKQGLDTEGPNAMVKGKRGLGTEGSNPVVKVKQGLTPRD